MKASGGIRDYPVALAMVKAGATRLGVSASLAIVAGTGLLATVAARVVAALLGERP